MDLDWLLPRDIVEFSSILLGALILDFLYPYHSGIMYKIHPVHTAYTFAIALYRKLPKNRLMGVALWIATVFIHTALYMFVLYVVNSVHRVLWILFSIYLLKVSLSLKLLLDYVKAVYLHLKNRDIVHARKTISNIVRRSVENLYEGHIASAAIESLFESLVDGFTSPLFFYLFLGSIGALIQRLANTMDSALGYREPMFKDIGWFSAKVDTILNFVPARLTALITLALCSTVGGSIRRGWYIYLRDRKSTESINAGNPMAATAGCLGVKLEKIESYTIGREFHLPTHSDVLRAVELSIYVSIVYVVFLHLLVLPIHHLIYLANT
ncbi:MAG: cobalamin biosynthesis protein [Ignisphaera sp.]